MQLATHHRALNRPHCSASRPPGIHDATVQFERDLSSLVRCVRPSTRPLAPRNNRFGARRACNLLASDLVEAEVRSDVELATASERLRTSGRSSRGRTAPRRTRNRSIATARARPPSTSASTARQCSGCRRPSKRSRPQRLLLALAEGQSPHRRTSKPLSLLKGDSASARRSTAAFSPEELSAANARDGCLSGEAVVSARRTRPLLSSSGAVSSARQRRRSV